MDKKKVIRRIMDYLHKYASEDRLGALPALYYLAALSII